jgi:hypothetical protein
MLENILHDSLQGFSSEVAAGIRLALKASARAAPLMLMERVETHDIRNPAGDALDNQHVPWSGAP